MSAFDGNMLLFLFLLALAQPASAGGVPDMPRPGEPSVVRLNLTPAPAADAAPEGLPASPPSLSLPAGATTAQPAPKTAAPKTADSALKGRASTLPAPQQRTTRNLLSAAADDAGTAPTAAAAAARFFDGGASPPQAPEPAGYRKGDIVNARFGDAERQSRITRARTFKASADKMIIGQGRATQIVQDKLVQYVEGYGTRAKEPVAVHLLGLSGIGKTAMLDVLEKAGFVVEKVDAQKFTKATNGDWAYANELQKVATRNQGRPYVLFIDELDKLPEIVDGKEETIPFVGAVNQILSNSSLNTINHGRLDFPALVITAMNFGPKEIENFSAEALKKQKKFLDFDVDDFAKFDAWVRKDPAAPYKLLSSFFRPNTVDRLAPNVVIMNSFSRKNYRAIVRLYIDDAVAKATQGANAAKRIAVSYTAAFEDFLYQNAVFAPSGTRETVARVDSLTQQLIAFGTKASAKGDRSLGQPRRILLDFDPATGSAELSITPRILRRGKMAEGSSFKMILAYDPLSKRFVEPANVVLVPPPLPVYKKRRPTKRQVLTARFYDTRDQAAGLAKKICLVGQETEARRMEKELNAYLRRPGPAADKPPFIVYAGFPGLGKSELIKQAAEKLGLPLVRINMQLYSSDSVETVQNFGQVLADGIADAEKRAPNGKFMILFEELDKVFEIDEHGTAVNRPIMAIIKDLFQDGVASVPTKSANGDQSTRVIDARGAFNSGTMNFRGDLFGFKADPRWTTIEDTVQAAQSLAMSPAALRKILDRLFLPDTISRLISRFRIMMPLDEAGYKQLIRTQADEVVKKRFVDPQTRQNDSRLTVQMTPAYRRYLFGETVIPSEGARNTVVEAQKRIAVHLEDALARIPRSSPIAAKPAVVVLDFKPAKSEVVISLLPETQEKTPKRATLYREKLALTFPPLTARGRLEEERIRIATHEFGHAFAAVRLGLRFAHAIAVPLDAEIGGFVSYPKGEPPTARTLIAHIYSSLGSRAMERIIMSDRPESPLSVLDISQGPRGDIVSVTEKLWEALHQLGFDPFGGTMERSGRKEPTAPWQYAEFSALPSAEVDRLGRVARKMEDQLVADLLKAHDLAWYQGKILRFAKAGGLTESEFYALIEFPHPGLNASFLGENSRIAELFAAHVKKSPPEVAAAKAFKQGGTQTTAVQNMDAYLKTFVSILKEELHPDVRPVHKLDMAKNPFSG